MAIAGEGAGGRAFHGEDGAIAVVLDLMDPALDGRRLINEGRHHGTDKARTQGLITHNLDMEWRGCKGELGDLVAILQLPFNLAAAVADLFHCLADLLL
jgi:hypothetical protein